MTDAKQFETLLRNYQDMVFSTAMRLVANTAEAEDISQEVFLRAFERFGELAGDPRVGGWLKTVAINLSLNHLSRYRKRWRFFSEFKHDDESDDAPQIDVAVPDTLFEDLAADERHAIVERALADLPEHQRVALVLYHFEEMSYEDIARSLHISLAKLKTDILRARAKLAKSLAEQRPQ